MIRYGIVAYCCYKLMGDAGFVFFSLFSMSSAGLKRPHFFAGAEDLPYIMAHIFHQAKIAKTEAPIKLDMERTMRN